MLIALWGTDFQGCLRIINESFYSKIKKIMQINKNLEKIDELIIPCKILLYAYFKYDWMTNTFGFVVK